MTQELADRLGPVDVVVVEFPDGAVDGSAFDAMLEAVDQGIVRVLDLEFVSHDADGAVRLVDGDQVAADAGVPELVGASSGLLDEDDVAFVGEVTAAGSLAAVIVYEQVWVFPVVEGLARAGAHIVSTSHLDVADIAAALDEE